MAAAQAGDRDALDRLLRRHYDRVHAVCRRIAGPGRDADDAAQEAMIGIVRGLGRFDGRSAFSTWAYRIATNAALDELRRRRRRPAPHAVADDEPWPELVDPLAERRVEATALRMAIDDALDDLPEEFRAPVVLRDVADLDYAEIAEVLSIPLGTVKSRIARGRAQLAEALGNQDSTDGRPTPHETLPATSHTMNDDQRQLANAYLDDEVTVDEQARAEADPEVSPRSPGCRPCARRCASPNDRMRRAATRPSALRSTPSRSGRRPRSPRRRSCPSPRPRPWPPSDRPAGSDRWPPLRPLSSSSPVVSPCSATAASDDGDDAASVATPAAEELEAAASMPAPADTAEAAAPPDAGHGRRHRRLSTRWRRPPARRHPCCVRRRISPPSPPQASEPEVRTNADDAVGCAPRRLGRRGRVRARGRALTVDVFVDDGEAIAADSVTCEVVARAQLP